MRLLWILALSVALACPSGLAYNVGRFPGKGSKADFEKASTLNDRGAEFAIQQNYKEALACFQKAIKIYPFASAFYSNCAAAHSKLKEKESAIQFYKKAIEIDRKNTAALAGLSSVYREARRYPESEQLCRESLRLEPNDPASTINLGEILIETGKPAEGKALLIKAKKLPGVSDYLPEVDEWIQKANKRAGKSNNG